MGETTQQVNTSNTYTKTFTGFADMIRNEEE